MRELKFRVFNKGQMHEPFTLRQAFELTEEQLNPEGGRLLERKWPADSVFMQYTGLKDKRGTEIYEDDIVTWKDGSDDPQHWRYARIEYENETVSFVFKIIKGGELPPGYQFGGSAGSFGGYDELEVLGNIYQHMK